MEFRLVRIEGLRLEFRIVIDAGRGNRLVVGDVGQATQNRLLDLFAVSDVLHALDEIGLVARCHVKTDIQVGIVTGCGLGEDEAGLAFDQTHGARLDRGGKMDVAGKKCIHAGIVVRDSEEFERVHMSAARLEVVRVLGENRLHARFESLELEGAGADALGEIGRAVLDDHEMVHRQDGRKVGIGVGECDLDRCRVNRLDVGDLLGDRVDLGAYGRIKVTLQREDDVGGGERLAVMEGNARA
ncbi:hypothetical protein D3C73_552740 [compost metagenome]